MKYLPSPRTDASLWWLPLAVAIGPLSWGTTYAVTSELLPPGHPLWSGLLRALPAGVLALALGRRLPTGSWWWRAALLGALNIGLFFPLLFAAAYLLPGGVAAVVGGIGPLLVAALAWAILGERPTVWRLGWGVVAVAGVVLVALTPAAALNLLGLLAAALGVVSMSLGTVLTKRWGRPPGVGPLAFAGWQLTAGGLLMVPLALTLEGGPPRVDAPALLGYTWLSLVGTLLAYSLWFWGLGRVPAGQAAFLPQLSPVVAGLLGWVVLGDDVTVWQLLGFVLALAAIVASQMQPARRVDAMLGPRARPHQGA